jgi:hypothetical protein
VPDLPADIRSRPHDLACADAIEILHAPLDRDGMTAVIADDPFRNTGRPRGIEDVERVGRGHWHAVHRRGLRVHLLPVQVSSAHKRRRFLRSLEDEALGGLVLGQVDRLVQQRLVWDNSIHLDAAGRRQDQFGRGVIDARR